MVRLRRYADTLTSVTDPALHRALGLTDGEFERIRALLGRDPNDFELAVFSLLWSEHCGYKHSALLLKRLPSTGTRVLQGPGENAGVLDLGDGQAVAFKVESHNHPSAVEPFQGAATGVGGILRDIVAMGARPVALLDGLRFAEPDWHFSRAVGGIGHYGNCVGVPTVGGEAVFDEAYRDNCLVNAMCVGLLPADRLLRAKATAAGQLVVLYGATTGRDGIGGASVLASQELDDAAADKRPSVQIGDPFTGKKLIESSVELTSSGLVESLQDCGAAGIASSLSEMAAEFGIDVRLDRVPLREEGMEPWEVMISESQERMIAIVRPQMLEAVESVLDRWELEHAVVGEVTATGKLRAFWHDEVVGEIPARLLTDECPRYEVGQTRRAATPAREVVDAPPAQRCARRAPRLARASQPPVRVPPLRPARRLANRPPAGSGRGGDPAPPVHARPRRLARRTGAHRSPGSVRRWRARGARGGAERRVRRWRADRVHGLPELREPGEARDRLGARAGDRRHRRRRATRSAPRSSRGTCRSTTRRTGARSIRRPSSEQSASSRTCVACRRPGARATCSTRRSRPAVSLAGSEYQARFGELGGMPAPLELDAEARLVSFLWQAAPLATLTHDASEGGLAVCLAEAAIFSGLGAALDLRDDPIELFGEVGGRAIVACAPGGAFELESRCGRVGRPAAARGRGRGRYPAGSGAPALA